MKAFRIAPLALSLLIVGCSTDDMLMQRKVDYGTGSDNLAKAPLDVPPDLTAPQINSYFSLPARSQLADDASAARTQSPARLVSAGGQRWLIIKGEQEKIWADTRAFWLANGFILTMDKPELGLMETDWLENRAKLPNDLVSKLLNKVSSRFSSTGELDKYRIRMERGTEPGTVELFISHRGLIEVYRNDGSSKLRNDKNEVETIWTPRPSDPELEAEMLLRLMQQFGIETQTARDIVKAPQTLSKTELATLSAGEKALSISDSYDRAWRRVGLALERIGYLITDRDRSKGTFYVRHADTDIDHEASSGFWSKLALWRSDEQQKQAAAQLEYQVLLKQENSKVILTLKPKDKADVALEKQLLDGLYQELK